MLMGSLYADGLTKNRTTFDRLIIGSTVVESKVLGTVGGVGASNRSYLPPPKGGHAGQYAGRGSWRSSQGPLHFL